MVFESVVADILNLYIGDYVENLDRSQLQIGIWGGDVVLQDLVLKPSSLDELDLPLKCTFGHLGRLVLKIPWKNLYSAPVIATVERLYLLAVPDSQYHNKNLTQKAKLAELQRLEVARCLKKEADKTKSSDTFVEKLATQIIKNIQIRIQDIHIRYEDAITNPKCPFSSGITLHNLSVLSTDRNWREGMVQDTSAIFYKVLNLQGLAIYWNCQGSQFSQYDSKDDLLNLFQKTISSNGDYPEKMSYILGPITSAARLQLNPKPESDESPFQVPKIMLTVLMETLALGMSKEQYHSLVELLNFFDFSNKISEYQKFRPNVPKTKGYFKEWWKFAKNCILSDRWRGIEWDQLKRHCDLCRDYANVYMKKLQAGTDIPNDLQSELCRCESELDVFNIIRIRRQAEAEVEWMNQKSPKEVQSGGLSSWLGSWWKGADTTENNELTDKFKDELTAEERLKLYQAIEYEENAGPAQYPEDFVERNVIFQLGKLIVDIRDNESRVLLAELSGVYASLEQRPSAGAFRMSLKMNELGAWGVDSNTAQMVKSLTNIEDGSEPVLMKLLLETNPLDKSCGRRLHIHAAPLQLIYDAQTILRLAAIFQGPQSEVLSQLQAAAEAQLSEMSALGLQYAIEHHVMTELEIDLKSSYILLPYEGYYTGCGDPRDLLVINLGQLKVMTLPRDFASNPRILHQQGLSAESIVATLREESYDRFLVELKNVQVLLALAGEDWQDALKSEKSGFMHLVEPASFSCQLDKCLVQNDPSLPNLKITGRLSTISFIMEDYRIIHLLQLYESIPFSEANECSEGVKLEMNASQSVNEILDNYDTTSVASDIVAEFVKLNLNFTLEGVTVTWFKSSRLGKPSLQNTTPEKILELRALHLGFSILQRTYDITITAHLGGVTLVYSNQHESLTLLDPSSHNSENIQKKDMLTIKYTNVTSPDKKMDDEVQYLEADFSFLTVLLHHEVLLALLQYGQTFSHCLETISTVNQLSQRSSQQNTKSTTPEPKKKAQKIDSNFKYSSRLHAFNISLLRQKQAIAHFMVEGMEVDAVQVQSSTTISARLRNVCLLDPNPLTSHDKIVSILGKEALSLEVVVFKKSKKKQKVSTSMSIKAHLTRSRIVFLNSFTNAVMDFLNSFQQAQENIVQAVSDAAEAAKKKVLNAHAESQFVILYMSFEAPLILVPVSTTSLEVLQMDFGQLLIKNQLEEDLSGPYDLIQLDLQQLQVARVKLNTSGSVASECKLVLPVTFTLSLTRYLTLNADGSVPAITVRGHLDNLEVSLNQNDVQMVMRILAENFDSTNAVSQATPHSPTNKSNVSHDETQKPLQWNLDLSMSTLKLHLGLNQHYEIDFAMSGSEFSVQSKKNMLVKFRIKDLTAINPSATSNYRKVVAVEENEALYVEVIMKDKSVGTRDNDMTVKATMACIRIIYLQSLISALMEFLQAFNYEPDGLVEAMAGVAEAAKEEVMEVHKQATRIGLNIDLKAPVIILPHRGMENDVLLLDFGNLTIRNTFQTVTDQKSLDSVLVDDMMLGLQNLKISRVELGVSGEILSECSLLQPIDLSIGMKRNLSNKKYSSIPDLDIRGHLKSVLITVNQEDVQLVMGVLSTFSDSSSQVSASSVTSDNTNSLNVTEEKQTNVSVLFSFTMDKLVVELFDEIPLVPDLLDAVSKTHSLNNSLACWSLILLEIRGTMTADGSLSTNLYLTDCQLDDSRPERQSNLTRIMERKVEHRSPHCSTTESRNMEIFYYKKGQMSEVKVHVYSFNLVLSLEYLRQLGNFFSKAFDQPPHETIKGPDFRTTMTQQLSTFASSSPSSQPTESVFSLFLHAENPDVFLVEDMGDPKTVSLVLKSDIKCAIHLSQSETQVQGTVKGLQLYSCCYHPDLRKSTMSQILQPCSVKIEGTSSHFEVQVSNLRLRVSPGTINLLSRVMTAVYSREENAREVETMVVNYSHIWTPKLLSSSNHWFLKTEMGEDALEMSDNVITQPKSVFQTTREVCILKMPSLTVTVEAGAGSYTLPMIMLTAGINAMALDWSSKLVIDGSMSVQMAYYNSRLALWEPLIEPVEVGHVGNSSHKPWELMAKIVMDNSSTPMGDMGTDEPCTSINIHSQDSLELTLTKTCLEVLQGLSQAFQLVGDEVQREGPPAPYHIINHTGVVLTLLLDSGSFKEFSYWKEESSSKCLVQPGESVPLKADDQINLQSPLSLLAQGQAQEKYLRILIEDLGDILDLPVVQAGQRHFPLKQDWSLISDICVESGSTIITLRSIVQVYNNLGMAVDIHCKSKVNSELEYVDTVPSGEHIDVPFSALYTPTRELYISVPGYHKVMYAWAQDFSITTAVLHECKSILRSSKETVFLRILREKYQAYSKATNTQTSNSSFYKIFVQPAVKIKNLLPVGIVIIQMEENTIHALAPGERINIATAQPDVSKLLIQIPEYRHEEWQCKFPLNSCEKEFSVLTFFNGRGGSLTIGVHFVYKQGVFIVTLYSPYWILNKTGLPLSYKISDGSTVVSHQTGDARSAVMFPSFSDNMKAAIQVADGDWSQCFSLDTPGSTGIVNCPALGQLYRLGVSVQLMRCTLTKQVTVTPHFVVINSCQHVVECQEANRPADLWVKVEPGDCSAIWPANPDNPVKLRARVSGTRQVSAAFPCSVAHTTLLRLDNQYGGLNVDVHLTESSVYITFTSYEAGQAAALFVNHSDLVIPFSEKGSNAINLLNPETELLFTWMEPAGPREIDFMTSGSKQTIDKDVCQLRADASGRLELQPGKHVFWSSFLDGAQRVMLFSRDPSITQSRQEAGKGRIQRSLLIDLPGLGLSIVDNKEKIEILYMAVTRMPDKLRERYNKGPSGENKRQVGLWMQVTWLPHEMQVHAKLDHLQADCQIPDCTYPIALAPVPPSRSVAASNVARPFMEFSAVIRKAKHSSLQQVQYCKALIQAFQVKVDMGLISALAGLVEAGEPSDEVEVAQFLEDFLLVKALLAAHVALGAARGQKHYFCLLHFSPLKIHLSLSLSGEAGVKRGREPPHALKVLLHSLGVTLTNVHDVVLRLAYFERQDALLSGQQLWNQAYEHYRSQVLKQLYVFVLGLDVLGNPLNFVKGLKQGVEDMFYEPIQGAIQGPEEFAQGLALGVRSLFGHTVGGAFGAASRITGAMGSGVAALTFDEDYKKKRQETISNRSSSVAKGFAQSGEGLVKGVVDGVSGVFTKPITGAKKEGVEGFFKGFGKGMVGLVARPTAGIIDFASGSFDALRRTTDTTVDVEKQRPPRFFRNDGRVRPYVLAEAEGNKILQDLEKHHFAASDIYDCHFNVQSSGQCVLMLTNKRVMLLSCNQFLETWKMDWQIPWEALHTPMVMDDGICFLERSKHSKKSKSKESGHKVKIQNKDTIQTITDKMSILMKL